MNMFHRGFKHITTVVLSVGLLAAGTAQAGKLAVNSADPSEAEQETIGLEVFIDGEGFDDGTQATFLVSGSRNDTGGITVVSTSFISPGRLKALINVDSAATLGDYDIQVETTRGRRGKGGTLFTVLAKGSQGYNGEPVPQDCLFADAVGDNVTSDGLGIYSDSVDKVGCEVHGLNGADGAPGGLVINSVGEGAIKKAVRKIDLALASCTGTGCAWIPNALLVPGENIGDMEDLSLALRPYPEQDDIQLLPAGEHRMSLRIHVYGLSDRYVVQFMNRVFPPEFHQGSFCDLEQNPDFDPDDAISDDMTVYIWPDGDGDTLPDGYTVTTGSIGDTSSMPPEVIPGARTGTVCSNDGPQRCGGPGRSDMCNLLGRVEVQYTMHAVNQ